MASGSWVDRLFAACVGYTRGTDCRALLPGEDCTTCMHVTDEEVCVTLRRRFNLERGGGREVQPHVPTPASFPVAAPDMEEL